jgi:lipopolysaccharide transport system permease protein
MATSTISHWEGDYFFLLKNLLLKDFRVRYRNMSLGFLWSVANPLVMMGVLTFVFTKVNQTGIEKFPVFLMCGLVPFNFFAIGWVTGTTSLVDNANLVKRLRFPREIIPVSAVLANCIHFVIQLGILLALALAFGLRVHIYWLWLPLIAALEVVFTCGAALVFSALNVYIRDTRYLVESANTVLFWLVPIFYSFTNIPPKYELIYRLNPVAAVVIMFRHILYEQRAPHFPTLLNLLMVSSITLALGLFLFRTLRKRFFDYV